MRKCPRWWASVLVLVQSASAGERRPRACFDQQRGQKRLRVRGAALGGEAEVGEREVAGEVPGEVQATVDLLCPSRRDAESQPRCGSCCVRQGREGSSVPCQAAIGSC